MTNTTTSSLSIRDDLLLRHLTNFAAKRLIKRIFLQKLIITLILADFPSSSDENGYVIIPLRRQKLDYEVVLRYPMAPNELLVNAAHELVHIAQRAHQHLFQTYAPAYTHISTHFRRRIYPHNLKYITQPWEIEAYSRAEQLAKEFHRSATALKNFL